MKNIYRGRVEPNGSIEIRITPEMELADQALLAVCARHEPMVDSPALRREMAEEHQRLLRQAFEEAMRGGDERRLSELSRWMDEAADTLEWTLQQRVGCFGSVWQQFFDREAYEAAREELVAGRP